MQARIQGMAALALLAWVSGGRADELVWRPARTRPAAETAPAPVSLGQPEPVRSVSYSPTGLDAGGYIALAPKAPPSVVRGQSADAFQPTPPPPPPPPPGFGAPGIPAAGVNPGEEAFNCGAANTPPGGGGFWAKFCDRITGAWKDVTGSIKTGSSGATFQSDHKFDMFASPVSNPFYFQDPRSLTEIRPLFIWQRTPSANPIFAGGNNFFVGTRGSLAFTDWLSVTLDELGWAFMDPRNPQGDFNHNNGFAEMHLGPKVTFIRNDVSGTVAAAGLIFELPVGPDRVFQHTHNYSLTPYFSIAQNFGRSDYGTFNFMNTTGYSFGAGSPRGDFFYSSFHLDYDVGNLRKIYPLVELNWAYYSQNGNKEAINFEGRDLFHFGSTAVSGLNELTLALGARYMMSQNIQFGLVGEFNILGNSSRHMDSFRLTFDVIFRY